ncbi:MAG: hypothetical protein ABIU54_00545 [Candidatus Eisenbacteria bacterium]
MFTLRSRIRQAAIPMVLAALIPPMAASAGSQTRAARTGAASHVACAGSIQHPVAVHITALDPVRRGQLVRLRVNLRAERAFERAEVRISSSGGAAVTGMRNVPLRAVPAGGQADADFSVMVPASGPRVLVQFEVEAEGAFGLVRRGATYNLLPDGPSEHPRATRTSTGEMVAEVTARRIER